MKKRFFILLVLFIGLIKINSPTVFADTLSKVTINDVSSKSFRVYDITESYSINKPFETILADSDNIRKKFTPIQVSSNNFSITKNKLYFVEDVTGKMSPVIFVTDKDNIVIDGKEIPQKEIPLKPISNKVNENKHKKLINANDKTILSLCGGILILSLVFSNKKSDRNGAN